MLCQRTFCVNHVGSAAKMPVSCWWLGMPKQCLRWVALQGDRGSNQFMSYLLSCQSFLKLVSWFWSTRRFRVLSAYLHLVGLPCDQHVLGNQIPSQRSFWRGHGTWKRRQDCTNSSWSVIATTNAVVGFSQWHSWRMALLRQHDDRSVCGIPDCLHSHGQILEHAASRQPSYHSWSGLHFACLLRCFTDHVYGDLLCHGHGCILWWFKERTLLCYDQSSWPHHVPWASLATPWRQQSPHSDWSCPSMVSGTGDPLLACEKGSASNPFRARSVLCHCSGTKWQVWTAAGSFDTVASTLSIATVICLRYTGSFDLILMWLLKRHLLKRTSERCGLL